MVDWKNEKEQIFWIKMIIAIISSVVLFFLMQIFPVQMIQTPILLYFTLMVIMCFLITFLIPPIVLIIFNKLLKNKIPPISHIFFHRTGTMILIFSTIFTILFILNLG
ncbi:MAG: hypothetical protein ACTSUG_18215 [Candidatus Helarchaeota archaeon]